MGFGSGRPICSTSTRWRSPPATLQLASANAQTTRAPASATDTATRAGAILHSNHTRFHAACQRTTAWWSALDTVKRGECLRETTNSARSSGGRARCAFGRARCTPVATHAAVTAHRRPRLETSAHNTAQHAARPHLQRLPCLGPLTCSWQGLHAASLLRLHPKATLARTISVGQNDFCGNEATNRCHSKESLEWVAPSS